MVRFAPTATLLALALLVPSVGSAQGASGHPAATAGKGGAALASTGRAVRAPRPPVVDGRADDDVWQLAPAMDGFRQFIPAEDGDPSFRTEVRVSYDDKNLYVLVRAFDPHPDSIVAFLSRRDVNTNSDKVKIIIDGYSDRRTGVEMAVNPAGVKLDAIIYSDHVEDLSWDGIWDAAARVDSLGWLAEFRVPFGQIRFNPGMSSIGFGVWRDIARRSERVAWPLYRTSRQALASQLGRVDGFEGIGRGGRLELLPYSVTRNVTQRTATGWHHPQQLALGADLKYKLTPNLVVDATVNPDFGQVEVDPAILNLTAFEVRFEERRPFFQEGVGLFRCGGPCEGLFYSRRIGRTPQLRSAEADPAGTTILGAAKLTGRLQNGIAIGLIEAVTDREMGADGRTVEPRTNYLVGRMVKEMRQGRSALGVMATAVNRDLDAETAPFLRREAYTTLLQGFHRFARDQWELMAYTGNNVVRGSEEAIARTQLNSVHFYQRPDHEERFDPTRTSLGGSVVAASLSKIGGAVRWNGYVRRASAGLELNDLGFVPTVNDISVRNTLSLQALRPGRFYRRSYSQIETATGWTTGGLLSSNLVRLHTSFELKNFWSASFTWSLNDLFGPHCVSCARGGPAVRQTAKHDLQWTLNGDPRRRFIPNFVVATGGDEMGRSYGVALVAGGELRVASRFSMSLQPQLIKRNDDQQWVGNFGALLSDTTHYTFARLRQTTVQLTTRANWTASPTLSFQLYALPFVSTGEFLNWRELRDPRAKRYDDRFKPYGGRQSPPGFNFKQFNTNAVARWEYRPGSTLFLVWQQGRLQDGRNPGSFEFSRDVRDLFRAHPDNVFLVKMSYWLNP